MSNTNNTIITKVEFETLGIENKRLYRCTEDNKEYFTNGFAISSKTKQTLIIYTDVKSSVTYARTTKDFSEITNGISKFKLIEDLKNI